MKDRKDTSPFVRICIGCQVACDVGVRGVALILGAFFVAVMIA
jgi:hypothetical protein